MAKKPAKKAAAKKPAKAVEADAPTRTDEEMAHDAHQVRHRNFPF